MWRPRVSPAGRLVAFMSEKDLFTIELFIADATTGEVVRKLKSANSDPHADAERFIDSVGLLVPDGRSVRLSSPSPTGPTKMVIVDTEDGDADRRIG